MVWQNLLLVVRSLSMIGTSTIGHRINIQSYAN